jgi:hypothetical protein
MDVPEDSLMLPQRLVIYAGPHLSSKTSVSQFFVEHAANSDDDDRLLPAFANWTWPFYPQADDPDAFRDLVINHPVPEENEDRRRELWSTILAVWGHARIDPTDYNAYNMLYPKRVNHVILGTEEFDRIPPTPFTNRNGLQALQTLLQITTQASPDDTTTIVVNYPTPRADHWIRLWKEWMSDRATSYREFLCASYVTINGTVPLYDTLVWEFANTVAHPLRMVDVFRKQGWKVALMDIGGIHRDGMDLPNVIACEVMGVPCTKEGRVDGLDILLEAKKKKDPLHHNPNTHHRDIYEHHHSNHHRGKDSNDNQHDDTSGLSSFQKQELEWLFRQRDCFFKKDLENDPGVTLHHLDSLWKDCPSTNTNISPTTARLQMDLATNATLFANLLKDIAGCSPEPETTRRILLLQQQQSTTFGSRFGLFLSTVIMTIGILAAFWKRRQTLLGFIRRSRMGAKIPLFAQ